MMNMMNVNLAGVELKNPVMTASGTFGSGAEYSEFVDLNRLGAVVTKGGKRTVAGKSYTESDRDRIRNAQCHWSSESGIDVSVKEIFRSLKNMIQRSSSMSVEICRRLL